MSEIRSNWSPGDLAYWLHRQLSSCKSASDAELRERLGVDAWYEIYLHGLTVHDRRAEPRPKGSRGRPREPRKWSEIFGVTVHQTASGHLHADHRSVTNIPAHAIIHQDDAITLLHPAVLRMPHGNALNGPTIGVEVDCRVPGLLDDPSTEPREDRRSFWLGQKAKNEGKSMEELIVPATSGQMNSLEKLLLYYHGMFITHAPDKHHEHWGVYTHRQGHSSRASDPGQFIAQHLEVLRAAENWKDVSLERYGTGRPQPDQWVGRSRGVRYL